MHLRIVAEATRPPVIEPNKTKNTKHKLIQVRDTNSRLVIQNDILRDMLRSLVDAV